MATDMLPPELDQGLPAFFGWVPDPFDSRDRAYKRYLDIPTFGKYSVNLRAWYPSTWIDFYDQGDTSPCVANSVAACFAFEFNKLAPRVDPLLNPSRSFLYHNARKGEGGKLTMADVKDPQDPKVLLIDNGAYIRLAMKSLQLFGVC